MSKYYRMEYLGNPPVVEVSIYKITEGGNVFYRMPDGGKWVESLRTNERNLLDYVRCRKNFVTIKLLDVEEYSAMLVMMELTDG